MKLFDDLKEAYTKRKVIHDCEKGKHRWTLVTEKLEDGTKLEAHVCQSCGVTDETANA